MSRKGNRIYKNNPTNSTNLNRLVKTLDSMKPNDPIMPSVITVCDKSDCNECELKNIIDSIVVRTDATCSYNNFTSCSFTGLSKRTSVADIVDPNVYSCCESGVVDYDGAHYYADSEYETTEIAKRRIDVQADIRNIDDILDLIRKYELSPDVEYNINMKSLHDIREPLEELNAMIGMKELKCNIVDQILYFSQDLHINENKSCDFMHTVIYGPPGTGKTDIAKLIGKIYSKIGILKKGTFKKVTRHDLIAGYLGQTALKTRDVIKDSLDGVLFIDEAYALGNSDKKDSFSKECIDTLCEALSDHKANLMVIIAGYEKELNDCFFNCNQGLESRFTWRFKTDKYNADDLYNIFLKKVGEVGWSVHVDSKISPAWFEKHLESFKFFGRDIESVLAKTKISHSRRVFCMPETDKRKINLADLEAGFDIFVKHHDLDTKKEDEYFKQHIRNSIYV